MSGYLVQASTQEPSYWYQMTMGEVVVTDVVDWILRGGDHVTLQRMLKKLGEVL